MPKRLPADLLERVKCALARHPKGLTLADLRADPLEWAEYEGMDYNRFFVENAFVIEVAHVIDHHRQFFGSGGE